MALPDEARASVTAYQSWLLARSSDAALAPRMQETLRDWMSLCRTDASSRDRRGPRVRIKADVVGFGDRTVRIPQPDYAPTTTTQGWRTKDAPLVGADIGGALLYGAGIALLDGDLYVDSFRAAPAAWLENGWYIPRETVGFADFDITDMSGAIPEFPPSSVRRLSREREYFLFNSNFGCANFGHFLHDTIAQIHAYDTISAIRGRWLTPILAAPLKYPMQEFIFAQLIGPLNEVVYLSHGPAQPEICFSTTRPFRFVEAGELSFHAMRTMRSAVSRLARARPSSGDRPRRVYVSRSDGPGGDRQFQNIDEAEALFARFGFTTAVLTRMSVEETLSMFGDADTVIGVHGAGLMNAMLSQRQPELFEVLDYPGSWTSIHMAFAAAGLTAHRIASLAPDSVDAALPRLDIEKLEALLAGLKT